jgi:iron complex outermembrane receptor protein
MKIDPMNRKLEVLVAALLCAAAGSLSAQEDMTGEWRASLTDMERRIETVATEGGTAAETWRDDAEKLRLSLASFAAAHPEMSLAIPEALPPNSTPGSLHEQLDRLRSVVDEVIRRTPGTPFNLGRVEVTVSATITAPSPVADSIGQPEIRTLNLTTAAKALDYLPGVSIQHIATNRNEAGIMVRGFSTRGQVPLYLDGIPISVPYDGYVDFNRFLTSDIAEVQVARGYSSPLLGPNALGGTINLVTQEPTKKLNADALIGTGSGNTLLSSLHLGSRWRRFFGQGTIDWSQYNFLPLSGEFPAYQYRNLPHVLMTDKLNNSWSRDERFSGRFGWTPRSGDEYVFSFVSLKGQKGVPLYQGLDTNATYRTFWSWPYWDMVNYYFHSNTRIGESNVLRLRGFYNQFLNDIDMYSDDTYSAMNTASAAHSQYDEHNDGASAEFNTRMLNQNSISASFFFKDDTHRERSIYPARAPFPQITPDLVDRDQQSTIGMQDVIEFSHRLRGTAGFSADYFNGLQGQAYNSASTGLVPFTCIAAPRNTSFAGCTAHVWNFNPQGSVSYAAGQGNFFFTFADRGRFPMLKDIYSASLGAGLPNPNLQPERSRSWNVGYSRPIGSRTLVQLVLFRSDLRDAIESVFVTDPGGSAIATAFCPNSRIIGFCSEMANIGKEVHEGMEFEVRSTPFTRLTVNASYSYLNRSILYDFRGLAGVSAANTSISILPILPRNKVIGTASIRAVRQVMGIVNFRYESGLTLQDTTYATTSPLFLPYAESFASTDLGVVSPIWKGATLHLGVKNVFDRNYYYNAGFPEAGRNWFLNLRYTF